MLTRSKFYNNKMYFLEPIGLLFNCTTHLKLTLQTEQNKSLKTVTAGCKVVGGMLTDQNGRSRPGYNNHNISYLWITLY